MALLVQCRVWLLFGCLAPSAFAVRSGSRRPPPLRLAFEATVRTERSAAGGPARVTELRVALDPNRLAIAMEADAPTGHHGLRSNVVIDIRRGVRTDAEPFFDRLVCFAFDLAEPQLLPRAGREAAEAFSNAVGEALSVPLHVYQATKQTGVRLDVSGHLCTVWAFTRTSVLKVPQEQLGVLAALAEKSGVSQQLLQTLHNGTTASLEIADSAAFCVDAGGQLRAVNASQRVGLVAGNRSEDLRAVQERVLLDVREPRADSPAFTPERQSAGGACVDLTSRTAKRTEMRVKLNDDTRLKRINDEAKGSWRAVSYPHWRNTFVSDIVDSLGTHFRPLQLPLMRQCGTSTNLEPCQASAGVSTPPPRHFDARRHWKACASIRTARNQGPCGSCWAVAAAGVMSDRFCIAVLRANRTHSANEGADEELVLSPQYLLDCSTTDGGCGGGRLDDAWEFLQAKGIPSESCDPYAFCPKPSDPQCGLKEKAAVQAVQLSSEKPHGCPSQCAKGAPSQPIHASHVYAVSSPGDVQAMQREILTNGPVEAAFYVFSDFHSYRRGTYFRTPSAVGPLGGHAVRLVGWGTDKQHTDFWLVANSFGREWGMHGFFRIRRGTNECGIETMPAAGLPELPASLP
mmetsp:Transcript_91247/g.258406  ORF Transcript_91247/g.258406 Transcript_91247/m.258406 type:complete len:630 (-) Transcript_91247:68-1957(-)